MSSMTWRCGRATAVAALLALIVACGRAEAPAGTAAGDGGDAGPSTTEPPAETAAETAAAPSEDGPLTLGFLGAFEGPAALLSEQGQLGAEIAVDRLNADGGVLGRTVELVVRDSTGRPEVAATNAQELVAQGVAAMVGGGSSAESLAISEVARASEVPLLVSLGNSEAITVEQGHEWVFQLQPSGGMEGRAIGTYAVDQGWDSVAVLAPDYEWGHSVSAILAERVTAASPDAVVEDPLFFPLGESDFSSYLTRLASNDAEAFVSYAWGGDAVSLAKQAEPYGLLEGRPVFGMWSFDTLLALGEDAPVGVVGFERAPFWHLVDQHPAADAFLQDYLERSGGEYPSGFSFTTFDAVTAWAQAVEQAGTAEAAAVRDALHEVEVASTRGPITFRELDNQATVPVYFGTIAFTDDYDFAILTDVLEIPASQTMIPEEELRERRGA